MNKLFEGQQVRAVIQFCHFLGLIEWFLLKGMGQLPSITTPSLKEQLALTVQSVCTHYNVSSHCNSDGWG